MNFKFVDFRWVKLIGVECELVYSCSNAEQQIVLKPIVTLRDYIIIIISCWQHGYP